MNFINKRPYWAIIIVGMVGIMMFLGSVDVSPTLASSECEIYLMSHAEKIESVQTEEGVRTRLPRPFYKARPYPSPEDDKDRVEVCPMTDEELAAYLKEGPPYFLLQYPISLKEGITSDLQIWDWESDL